MTEREELVAHLLIPPLLPPIPEFIIGAAERAIDLTAAGHADLLIDLPNGPRIPAGILVEMLDLNRFVP
jgi:hypothetical protein